MFHSGTQRLLDHWARLPRDGGVPSLAAFDPAELSDLSPWLMLADGDRLGLPLRLAGEAVIDLFAMPMRGAAFAGLWSRVSRPVAGRAWTGGDQPRVVVCTGRSDRGEAPFEVTVAPLATQAGQASRLLVLLQPTGTLTQLNRTPVRELVAGAVLDAHGGLVDSPVRLAAFNGRRLA